MYGSFVTPKKAKEILGVSDSTLRLWDATGKIKTVRTPSGTRLYDIKSILSTYSINVSESKE